MFRSISFAVLVIAAGMAGQGLAQQIKVEFPPDSPVGLVSADWGESRISPRGGAVVLDLRASLTLKNSGSARVRGITLLVNAADLTAGGKAFVTVPSLDVAPGQVFPVHVDLRLLRPSAGLRVPVMVALDGVLFDTLTFYGPNKLNSRRSLLTWELAARRDRKFFLESLARGPEALRQEIVASLARQDSAPKLNVQVTRGRTTAVDPAQTVQLAVLDLPGSPIEIVHSSALQAPRELSRPRFDLHNRSDQPIRHIELGWVARQSVGGVLPAEVTLSPGERKSIQREVVLRFPDAADPVSTYIASVEYEGGDIWIPGRNAAGRISPEEQRLSEIYRRKGLGALIRELQRFE